VSAALRSGAVVVDDPRYLENGRITLAIRTGPGPDKPQTLNAAGAAMPHRLRTPVALMTEQTATSLGLTVAPQMTLATTTRLPTVAEEDRLRSALGNAYSVFVERGGPSGQPDLLILAIVAAVIALAAAAIATGLAATDGRADLGTLAAVGASPRVRRLLSLSQSGVIAGLGSLLGAAAGLGASTAVLAALNQGDADVWPAPVPYPIAVPWLNLAVAVLVVPAVAMLGAGLLTGSRLPIERRL
jgi:putative ABC transport system permease protein